MIAQFHQVVNGIENGVYQEREIKVEILELQLTGFDLLQCDSSIQEEEMLDKSMDAVAVTTGNNVTKCVKVGCIDSIYHLCNQGFIDSLEGLESDMEIFPDVLGCFDLWTGSSFRRGKQGWVGRAYKRDCQNGGIASCIEQQAEVIIHPATKGGQN